MKVILLQDVAKIGKRSEIAEVPDGYALNQLIPKRMAEPATAANLKRIERLQAEVAKNQEAGQASFKTALKALNEQRVQIAAEVNEQGHLFKAIHEADVVEAAAAAGITVDAPMIVIKTPVKAEGEHSLELVHGSDQGVFIIEVVKK
jgi:large subunit ribosomal protein L9